MSNNEDKKVNNDTTSKAQNKNSRKFSSPVVDGVEQAPSRAMLRAVGFDSDDFKKPQIGIASTWSMVTPCNMHINELAEEAAKGGNEAGGKSVIFNTITISYNFVNFIILKILATNFGKYFANISFASISNCKPLWSVFKFK